MATALRKNRIPGPVLGLLLVIAAGLGLYFALLAPRAPAELPELGAFSGAVTVDHGSALIGAPPWIRYWRPLPGCALSRMRRPPVWTIPTR